MSRIYPEISLLIKDHSFPSIILFSMVLYKNTKEQDMSVENYQGICDMQFFLASHKTT